MSWELGGHLYTPYVLGAFWGKSIHLSGTSMFVSTSIYPSVHKSYQLLPIIVSCFFTGLNAYGYMLNLMPLTCSFLCSVFILSLASTTTAMTTTPVVTVVSSSMSSLISMVTMATFLMGLSTTSGQNDVVLPPWLTLRNFGGVVGLPLCCSRNLNLRCLFELQPIMPWVLHR